MRERFAIVTYEIRRAGRAGVGIGYLVETPDGHHWCFPSPETGGKYPDETEPFKLDPERLRPQPDDEIGRRCFVYAGGQPAI